jgi:hypothetical protein
VVTGGGYHTAHDAAAGIALPSNTSADWGAGDSLGTFFQRPAFQSGYSAAAPVRGAPGTAATLGQDPGFPPAINGREIIQLTWGSGFGLADGAGDDLAIFEQATSEAFAVRAHVTGSTPGWSAWFYTPYEQETYDADYDATPTLIDLAVDLALGAGAVINALEITNLTAADTVADEIDNSGFGRGQVTFDGGSGFAPGRWSGSRQAWVGFEAGKYDPDIQYVVALHDIEDAVSGEISPSDTGAGSLPARLPPAGDGVVALPGAPWLLALGFGLLIALRRPSVVPR